MARRISITIPDDIEAAALAFAAERGISLDRDGAFNAALLDYWRHTLGALDATRSALRDAYTQMMRAEPETKATPAAAPAAEQDWSSTTW